MYAHMRLCIFFSIIAFCWNSFQNKSHKDITLNYYQLFRNLFSDSRYICFLVFIPLFFSNLLRSIPDVLFIRYVLMIFFSKIICQEKKLHSSVCCTLRREHSTGNRKAIWFPRLTIPGICQGFILVIIRTISMQTHRKFANSRYRRHCSLCRYFNFIFYANNVTIINYFIW